MAKITIDTSTCVGCGLCEQTCPDVFEMIDEKACVKLDEVPDPLAETCREAAEECPVEAIQIEE